jgi:hypothetical protein
MNSVSVLTKTRVDEIARDCVVDDLLGDKEADNQVAIQQAKREVASKFAQEFQQELDDTRTKLRSQQESLNSKFSAEHTETIEKLRRLEADNLRQKQVIDEFMLWMSSNRNGIGLKQGMRHRLRNYARRRWI